MKVRLGRTDKIIAVGLLALTLLYRLATLMIIHTGVDERDYWFSAKTIARGLPYPDLNHRTTRFTVILPVAFAQVLLGSHPNVYYVLPVLNSMLQALLSFIIGIRLHGRLTGFLAALAITMFPYMIRAGSQVRPEIFSVTYLLLALLFFIEYMDRTQKEIAPLFWTGVLLFIGYEAKITNIYFVPGLLIAVLVYKRKPAHALLLCAVLFSLFLLETGAYAALTPYKLGELEIIMKHHIQEGVPIHVARVVDLFQRYSSAHLQLYWKIPFALFAAAAAVSLIKGSDRKTSALVLSALGFFVGITFEVAGLHPLTPAEPFINRYFTAVVGPVFLVLAGAVEGIVASRTAPSADPRKVDSPSRWILSLGVLAAAVLGLFSLSRLPAGIREYANSPLHPERHPLALNERYRRAINGAYEKGVPVVAVSGVGGQNALETCRAYYIDQSHYVNGRPPGVDRATRDGAEYLVLGRMGGAAQSGELLAVVRAPLRVAAIGDADLRNLSDNSFAAGSSPSRSDDE